MSGARCMHSRGCTVRGKHCGWPASMLLQTAGGNHRSSQLDAAVPACRPGHAPPTRASARKTSASCRQSAWRMPPLWHVSARQYIINGSASTQLRKTVSQHRGASGLCLLGRRLWRCSELWARLMS